MKQVKKESNGSQDAFKLIVLFLLWYTFNAGYNVYNSYVKNDFMFPAATSGAQLAVGLIYAIPLWILGIRRFPKISVGDFFRLLPIAVLNAAGHCCAVFAMFQKGGGSFTHVIKASEPVVSVILGLFIMGNVPKPMTALSLLPICYGVAYASTLGNLNVESMTKELTTLAAKY
jgi:solute carrier family 35 protein E1